MENIKLVHIVFFTGTGGTARIANQLETEFVNKQINVVKTELNGRKKTRQKSDIVILLFPVYACNAPKSVEEWIDKAPMGKGMPVAVLSVSGGGDVTPNTACRVRTIKQLIKKGYDVFYENSFVMPSNFLISYEDTLAAMLIKKSMEKCFIVSNEIIEGKRRLIKPNEIDRFITMAALIERIGSILFGKMLKINSKCTGCGWCANQCPRKNIKMKQSKPIFGGNCVICMRCIYGCPKHAIKPGLGKSFVLKTGYNLGKLEKRTNGITEFPPISNITKGHTFRGVKKFLEEDIIK